MYRHKSVLLCFIFITKFSSADVSNAGLRVLKKVYDQCSGDEEIIKCIKIQALKVADRALRSKSFEIVDGIKIVGDEKTAKALTSGLLFNETKLQYLKEEQINDLLADTTSRFLETHRLQFSMPNLAESVDKSSPLVEESRGRKKKKKGGKGGSAALMWALAIKGTFLAMAYKGIAVMAGTALLVGKMALLLSAILGLKKLVSHDHEKTTFEIVKHPKYSESHSHSSSYEEDGHYKRAWDPTEVHSRQEKVYRAYVKK